MEETPKDSSKRFVLPTIQLVKQQVIKIFMIKTHQ